MAAKTPIEQLNSAIMGILNDYTDEIGENLSRITEEVGKKGRQALRRESKAKLKQHTGEYAKGWQLKVEKRRLVTTATLYNDHYSLPHLLENSHRIMNKRGGPGATRPHPHIEPVEKELVETFEREVLNKL